jgi:hypothetical protein
LDSNYYIHFKIIIGNVFAINKGENIFLKLDDDQIIKLNVSEYEISGRGEVSVKSYGTESQGLYVRCFLSKDNIKLIKENKISKTRIMTTQGYVEDDIKEIQKDYIIT